MNARRALFAATAAYLVILAFFTAWFCSTLYPADSRNDPAAFLDGRDEGRSEPPPLQPVAESPGRTVTDPAPPPSSAEDAAAWIARRVVELAANEAVPDSALHHQLALTVGAYCLAQGCDEEQRGRIDLLATEKTGESILTFHPDDKKQVAIVGRIFLAGDAPQLALQTFEHGRLTDHISMLLVDLINAATVEGLRTAEDGFETLIQDAAVRNGSSWAGALHDLIGTMTASEAAEVRQALRGFLQKVREANPNGADSIPGYVEYVRYLELEIDGR